MLRLKDAVVLAAFIGAPFVSAAAAPVCPSYGAYPAAPADYAGAMSAFAAYRDAKRPEIRAEGDLPFIRTHGAATADAVLLVHGLTDSPYYVAKLADAFYDRGFNVVSVLLPGHGTQPECLLHVTAKQWEDETLFGLSVARRLGGRVSLAGFSTGGALSLDAIVLNDAPWSRDAVPIGNVFLFSPALGFDGLKHDLCDVPGVIDVMEFRDPWLNNPKASQPVCDERDAKTAMSTACYKYVKNTKYASCQLVALVQDNPWGLIGRYLAERGIGVFAVESMADTTVSPESVVKFVGSLPPGVRRELITYEKSEGIKHESVPRPETNPHFAEMIAAMDAFLAAPAPRAAAVPGKNKEGMSRIMSNLNF
jgi:pimeloyl-ACP methyl ester carboxylesterase